MPLVILVGGLCLCAVCGCYSYFSRFSMISVRKIIKLSIFWKDLSRNCKKPGRVGWPGKSLGWGFIDEILGLGGYGVT